MKKFKDIEELAKAELLEEEIAGKKEALKEYLREIKAAKKALTRLEKQYEKLLDEDIDAE